MGPAATAGVIRAAGPPDIPAMVALLEDLFALEADFHFSAETQRRGLELLLASPAAAVFVAEERGRVSGMITAQLTISTAEGGPALLVEDLVVAPGSRGGGTGTRLLRAVFAWGAGRGAGRLQLLADRDNQKALDFYAGRGWRRTNLICLRTYTIYSTINSPNDSTAHSTGNSSENSTMRSTP